MELHFTLSLTDDSVKHIAKLSSLELSEEEVIKMKTDLNDILGYMDKLSKVNTKGVSPTSHVHGITNVFREDLAKKSMEMEEIKKFAPDFGVGGFRVPKVIG